jgi:hypothetical protein
MLKQLLVCAALLLGNGALAGAPDVRTEPVRQAAAERKEPASAIGSAEPETAQTAAAPAPAQKGASNDAPYRNGGHFGGNFTDE